MNEESWHPLYSSVGSRSVNEGGGCRHFTGMQVKGIDTELVYYTVHINSLNHFLILVYEKSFQFVHATDLTLIAPSKKKRRAPGRDRGSAILVTFSFEVPTS